MICVRFAGQRRGGVPTARLPMRWLMAYFVSVDMRITQERLPRFLDGLRVDIRDSHQRHPGRLHTRVFQAVGDPGRLLSLGKWASSTDFARFRQHPEVNTYLVNGRPPDDVRRDLAATRRGG